MPRISPSAEQIERAREDLKTSPIYWFSRLTLALDHGDREAESTARRILHGLGWTIIRCSTPRITSPEDRNTT